MFKNMYFINSQKKITISTNTEQYDFCQIFKTVEICQMELLENFFSESLE